MQSRDIASDDFDDAKDMERLETKILTPKIVERQIILGLRDLS
jgi:hypothetical protein